MIRQTSTFELMAGESQYSATSEALHQATRHTLFVVTPTLAEVAMKVVAEREPLDLQRWFLVLVRAAPSIAVIILLSLGVTAVLTERQDPVYEARATVLLRPGALERLASSASAEDRSRLLANDLALLTSDKSRSEVADRSGIDLDITAEAIDPDGDSVRLSAEGSQPVVLAEDLNGWSVAYVDLLAARTAEVIATFESQAEDRLSSATDELAAVQAPLIRLDEEISQLPPGDERDTANTRRDFLEAQNSQQVVRLEDVIEQAEEDLLGLELVVLFQDDTSAEVLSPATVPTVAIRPDRRRSYLLALTIGTLLAFAQAGLRALANPTMLRPTDLAEIGMTAPVARVSRRPGRTNHRSDEADRAVISDVLLHPPYSPALVTCPQKSKRPLRVTPLAAAASAMGQTTVVVDADLRRPTLRISPVGGAGPKSGANGEIRAPGLSEILNGDLEPLDAVLPNSLTPGVDLVPAGLEEGLPPTASPSRWAAAITDLLPKYDLVLLSAPPLAAVPEGTTLAAASASAIVMIEKGRSQKRDVERLLTVLEGAGTPIAAVIWVG